MCMTLMVASLAMSAVAGMSAMKEAKKAGQRANQQAMDAYDQAAANTKAKYAETNRKIAESQIDAFDEKSDKMREANYALGTFRASETSLSDASLGTIFFEQLYGDSLDYVRLDRNAQREFQAFESEKTAAEIQYINETTMAKNNADNAVREANARRSQAFMNMIGSGLQIGTGYYNQQQTINTLGKL